MLFPSLTNSSLLQIDSLPGHLVILGGGSSALSLGRCSNVWDRPDDSAARAVEKGETQGFMEILVDAETRRILGAAISDTGGDEAIHCIHATLKRAVHIHPMVSELIPTMLGVSQPLA